MADFELTISYPRSHLWEGDEIADNTLGIERRSGSGFGFGWRDMHYEYASQSEGLAAILKMKETSLPHRYDLSEWVYDDDGIIEGCDRITSGTHLLEESVT